MQTDIVSALVVKVTKLKNSFNQNQKLQLFLCSFFGILDRNILLHPFKQFNTLSSYYL
ncbi:MAG: hypothetical protein MAG581_01026 [Deltaproteobacteria bacterium]|jgi:hypothetical protein|nr:hypothetical protein [Deltaproteobacteria bacterium]